MKYRHHVRKLSVFLALLVVASLIITSTVSARSLEDNSAPYVSNISYLNNNPLYIGITIVFPNGVPSPIFGAMLGNSWFQCDTGATPNTLYCWGHNIGDYPATLNIVNGLTNIILVVVPQPAGLPNKQTPPPPPSPCTEC